MRILLVLFAVVASSGGVVAFTRSAARPVAAQWVTPEPATAAVPAATPTPTPTPSPSPSALVVLPRSLLRAQTVTINSPGFWSWALLDTNTGKINGSKNLTGTSTTASMIKAWIAADYLRLTSAAGKTPSQARLAELTKMIRDSDNAIAETIFQEIGTSTSIGRLISLCKLTDSKAYQTFWSNTTVSARDTARMAACIGNGRAAGPKWTNWLLNEMRLVRGVGDFGIRDAFPPAMAKGTAIKNGWLLRDTDGNWHISCLAIGVGWTLGVLVRYPGSLGFTHGTEICRSVAAQLMR